MLDAGAEDVSRQDHEENQEQHQEGDQPAEIQSDVQLVGGVRAQIRRLDDDQLGHIHRDQDSDDSPASGGEAIDDRDDQPK